MSCSFMILWVDCGLSRMISLSFTVRCHLGLEPNEDYLGWTSRMVFPPLGLVLGLGWLGHLGAPWGSFPTHGQFMWLAWVSSYHGSFRIVGPLTLCQALPVASTTRDQGRNFKPSHHLVWDSHCVTSFAFHWLHWASPDWANP